jgi:hypothetical protein
MMMMMTGDQRFFPSFVKFLMSKERMLASDGSEKRHFCMSCRLCSAANPPSLRLSQPRAPDCRRWDAKVGV